MNYLFSDLDSTLIYSSRHSYEKEKVWIEELDGKAQSYITRYTIEYLKAQCDFKLIPVTTRTRKQFARLSGLVKAVKANDALICNGAVLMHSGIEDTEWSDESKLLFSESRNSLYEVRNYLQHEYGKERVVVESDFLVYAKVDNSIAAANHIKAFVDSTVSIFCDSRKVYCVPRNNNKGLAIKRYMHRYGERFCLGIGDSSFDIDMLKCVDYALYPDSLKESLQNVDGKNLGDNDVFSDYACEMLSVIKKR